MKTTEVVIVKRYLAAKGLLFLADEVFDCESCLKVVAQFTRQARKVMGAVKPLAECLQSKQLAKVYEGLRVLTEELGGYAGKLQRLLADLTALDQQLRAGMGDEPAVTAYERLLERAEELSGDPEYLWEKAREGMPDLEELFGELRSPVINQAVKAWQGLGTLEEGSPAVGDWASGEVFLEVLQERRD